MKKISSLLLGLSVVMGAFSASAQEKGDVAVGVNLGFAPCLQKGASLTNFDLGAKVQYNLTDPLRLEAAFDYGFKAKGVDVLTVGINAHYLFGLSEKLHVYPLVGVGYGHLGGGVSLGYDGPGMDYYLSRSESFDYPEDMDMGGGSASKFYFNVGVGGEYAISSHLAVNLEIKYQYMKDFSRLPISLGVAYRF